MFVLDCCVAGHCWLACVFYLGAVVHCCVGWLVGWLVGWIAGWLIAWLFGWLVGLLVLIN